MCKINFILFLKFVVYYKNTSYYCMSSYYSTIPSDYTESLLQRPIKRATLEYLTPIISEIDPIIQWSFKSENFPDLESCLMLTYLWFPLTEKVTYLEFDEKKNDFHYQFVASSVELLWKHLVDKTITVLPDTMELLSCIRIDRQHSALKMWMDQKECRENNFTKEKTLSQILADFIIWDVKNGFWKRDELGNYIFTVN